ncbi:MAG: hypothetical protein A2W29_12305 [Gemmatimonadetes bacterium RBG_16_66_8]|nr:MAG: hypothetical protein A2W29_12305 [Gemmatimonadetes bacterium RBG_16_66_8]
MGSALALRYAAGRLLVAVPLLLLVSVLVFGLIHAVPGGPVAMFLANPNVRPEDVARLEAALGLDRPLPVQYAAWIRGFVTGEWGYSITDGRPVLERLAERVPASAELLGTSLLLALLVSLAVAVPAAVSAGKWLDRSTTAAAVAGISLPSFWFGLVLQLVFAVGLGWLPSSGRSSFGVVSLGDWLAHLVLPATVLAALHAASWSRYLRSAMLSALAQPFVVSARARGLPEGFVVMRHALGNAVLPFVTVVLLDAAIVVSGAVVTESVFAWPGLGSLFIESLARRDYPVLMAFLMASAVGVVLLNLAADVVYRVIDPRVRP